MGPRPPFQTSYPPLSRGMSRLPPINPLSRSITRMPPNFNYIPTLILTLT